MSDITASWWNCINVKNTSKITNPIITEHPRKFISKLDEFPGQVKKYKNDFEMSVTFLQLSRKYFNFVEENPIKSIGISLSWLRKLN